jgi:hypothetical protein
MALVAVTVAPGSRREDKRIALLARLTLKFRRISRQIIERALCRSNQ